MDHLLAFVVRASATYVFLLILLRLAGKRTIGEGTPFDFVVALVLGDFPDDVIWGEVPGAQGLVAMGTVMALHVCVSYVSCRSARFDRLVGSRRTLVIRDGRLLPDALRRERMNEEDLDVHLRHHGREDRREVREASIEQTGEMAVLPTEAARTAQRRDLEEAAA